MNPHCSQCFLQFSQCFPDVFKPEHLPWTFQEPSDSQISTLLALGGRPFSDWNATTAYGLMIPLDIVVGGLEHGEPISQKMVRPCFLQIGGQLFT